MKLPSHARRGFRRNEDGYILLILILMVTLLIIAAAAIAPSIAFEIKRDREAEMIHRGVQYSRAVRIYYKKFGRYPAKIEDLENTNNLRYLRKRYKDPITGQDFKILHYGEVKMTFGAPLAGASNINGIAALNNNPGFVANSAFGQPQSGGNFGGGNFGNPSGFGAANRLGTSPDASTNPDQNQPGNSISSSSSSSSSSSTSSDSSTSPQPGQQQPGTAPGDTLSGQTFGGMPVVGVVSTSKKEGIREFNHKKKYSEWQFIYDPATDRGGLLMTPNQPPLQGFANQQLQPGQQGNPANSPFGSPQGTPNNPNPVSPAPNSPPAANPPNQ
jgi:type II secretory pathway pseudopilin PulG